MCEPNRVTGATSSFRCLNFPALTHDLYTQTLLKKRRPLESLFAAHYIALTRADKKAGPAAVDRAGPHISGFAPGTREGQSTRDVSAAPGDSTRHRWRRSLYPFLIEANLTDVDFRPRGLRQKLVQFRSAGTDPASTGAFF